MNLPAPRLQFRWVEKRHADGANWLCYYELVLPLHEHDIRRGALKKRTELIVNLGKTRITTEADVMGLKSPFRDGAHARWDRPHLGNPPVYAVCGNRVARLTELEQAHTMEVTCSGRS